MDTKLEFGNFIQPVCHWPGSSAWNNPVKINNTMNSH